LKILIAVDKTRFDYLIQFAEKLLKYDIQIKIINDLEIYDNSFFSNKILRWVKIPKKLIKIIDEFNPDIIFTERVSNFSSLILKIKIPLLIFLRGNYWEEVSMAKKTIHTSRQKKIEIFFKNRIAEKCFQNAIIILPICDYLKNIVKNRYPGKKIVTFYQGIDIDYWKAIDHKKSKSPCVGLLQGAHIWGKTQEMLTLEKVLKKLPNVTFYWAGDGPYAEKILSVLQKYKNFKWLGHLDYPDKVRDYLQTIDVYALISGMDMSPHSLLEASLMEKPVIATNVGGIPELIIDGETGFLVEKGNSNEIVEKILLLLNDNEKSKQMGKAGRKFIEKKFSWEKITEDFVNIIKKIDLSTN
jgi:glycosyltransferase involved in cell wall biosynthesis